MAYDFPNSPVADQLFTPPGGPTWKYVNSTWILFNPATVPVDADTEDGLWFDFTTRDALMRSATVPALNFHGAPLSLLTYTAPSPKLVWKDGLLQWGRHNAILQSQTFDNAYWGRSAVSIVANATTAPDGTMTADKIVEDTANAVHRIGPSSAGGWAGIGSVYVKAAERTRVSLYLNSNPAGAALLTVNLTTGAITQSSGTVSVENAGNGWWRLFLTDPAVAFFFISIMTVDTGNAGYGSVPYTGDGVSGIYVWGAQLSRTPCHDNTYLPTTTELRTELPYDQHPVTRAELGLLIEDQRTNLFTYTEDFTHAHWSIKANCTITGDTVTAPNGTLTADTLVENVDTAVPHNTGRNFYNGAVTRLETFSVFLKAAGRRYAWIRTGSADLGSYLNVVVDLQAGIVTDTKAGGPINPGNASSINPAGNGWYRVSVTMHQVATSGWVFGSANAAVPTYDGVNQPIHNGDGQPAIYAWGAQLEACAFQTSYIPTGASQVTRAIDRITMPLSATPYNNKSTGTLEAEADFLYSGSITTRGANIVTLTEGPAGNQSMTFVVYLLPPKSYHEMIAEVYDTNNYVFYPSFGFPQPGVLIKLAMAWADNDYAAISNCDGTLYTQNIASVPVMVTMNLGQSYSIGQDKTLRGGHLARLKLLPRRVSNDELQAMVLESDLGYGTPAGDLLGIEPAGFAVDFTKNSALVRGHNPNYSGEVQPLLNVVRACTANYIGSTGYVQSVSNNRLRYDHDPITHEVRGALIEEQRTNLCPRSQQFEDAAWVKAGTTATEWEVVSPDGAELPGSWPTGSRLTESSTNAEHRIYQSIGSVTVTTHTWSIYAKAGERVWLAIRSYFGLSVANFNLSTGTVGTVSASVSASIQSVGNGWYRCIMSAMAHASGSEYFVINIGNTDTGTGPSYAYLGDGVSGLYIWGAQLEVGGYPTSHIFTFSASQVTRAADQVGLATSAFPLSATAGAVVWEGRYSNVPSTGIAWLWSLDDETTNERILGFANTGGPIPSFFVADGGTPQLGSDGISDGAVAAGVNFKLACGWALNDFAMSRDGRTPITDTAGTLPTVTNLKLGRSQSNNYFLPGCIKKFKYLPRRASNAELQAMST